MTHICVIKLTIIGSDNGLSPGRHQAIIWTNAGVLLIGPLGTKFSEILIGIQPFSFRKMHLKMTSAKWRPICLGLNVSMWQARTRIRCDPSYLLMETQGARASAAITLTYSSRDIPVSALQGLLFLSRELFCWNKQLGSFFICGSASFSGLILGLRPANERRRYFVTTSLIGWAQA